MRIATVGNTIQTVNSPYEYISTPGSTAKLGTAKVTFRQPKLTYKRSHPLWFIAHHNYSTVTTMQFLAAHHTMMSRVVTLAYLLFECTNFIDLGFGGYFKLISSHFCTRKKDIHVKSENDQQTIFLVQKFEKTWQKM